MLKPLRRIAQDPMLGFVAPSIPCSGTLVASMAPNQSLVTIRIFGFPNAVCSVICGGVALVGMGRRLAAA